MSRTIEFQIEQQYRAEVTNASAVWRPEINAIFRTGAGKSRRGRALIDSGSDYCAMPREVAVDYLGIDINSCPVQATKGIIRSANIPYTTMTVRAVGVEAECKVLLMESDLYLVGRIPFFSLFDVAFHEETNGSNNRILFAKK
jgi:hypothetical protein